MEALIFLSSCSWVDNTDPTDLSPSEQDEALGKAPILNPDSFPLHMWSPLQRQANAGYYFLVGEYLAMKGEREKSYELFNTAHELDPNEFLAEKLVDKYPYRVAEKAIVSAKKMTLLYPRSKLLKLKLGALFLENKEYNKAIEQTQKALELDTKDQSAYLQLINIYQKKGSMKDAIEQAIKLTQVKNSALSWRLLSTLYFYQKQYAKALPAAAKAYQLQSDNKELLLSYAYLLDKQKKRKKALELYDKFFTLAVKHQETVSKTVLFLKTFGSFEAAWEKLAELSKSRIGNNIGLKIEMILISWEQKNFQKAHALIEELLRKDPGSPRLNFLAGSGYERAGKKSKALKYYKKVRADSDFFITAKYKMSQILIAEKKYQEALDVILETLPLKYATWELYILASQIYSETDSFTKAIAILQEGYQRYPLKTHLLFLKGAYEEKAHLLDECIATMRQVIAQDPQFSSAYNYLGYLFAEQGENLDEAEQLILKALQLKPDDGYYLDSLGWVYYKKEDYNKALSVFQKAIIIVPDEGVVYEHLGDVYLKLDKKNKAIEMYEKAIKGKMEDKERMRVQEKLQEFRGS